MVKGERPDRAAEHKKNIMKTKSNKSQSSELKSRPEQLSTDKNTAAQPPAVAAPEQAKPARILPYVNFQQRDENRALATEKVLDLLRQWMPAAYDLAEVVGKWVWVTFPDQPAETVRGQLSQFGFHWNNARKCWQHPCGQFATTGSRQDPRQKYGTHFAADLKAA
jgi:hypothetical protein